MWRGERFVVAATLVELITAWNFTTLMILSVLGSFSLWIQAQGQKKPPAKPIDLNAATIKEWKNCPVWAGHGQRIIEARRKVAASPRRGLAGNSWYQYERLDALRPYVTVSPPPPAKKVARPSPRKGDRDAWARIRAATRADLPRLTEIQHYVIHTAVTFDMNRTTVERRVAWFEQFDQVGASPVGGEDRYERDRLRGTTRFRPKAAYDTTVETTITARRATGSEWRPLYSAAF